MRKSGTRPSGLPGFLSLPTSNTWTSLRAEDIEAAPSFGTGVKTEFLRGLAKVAEGFVLILDVDRVLSSAELIAVADSTLEGAGLTAAASGEGASADALPVSSEPDADVEEPRPDGAEAQTSTAPSSTAAARASGPRKKRARK